MISTIRRKPVFIIQLGLRYYASQAGIEVADPSGMVRLARPGLEPPTVVMSLDGPGRHSDGAAIGLRVLDRELATTLRGRRDTAMAVRLWVGTSWADRVELAAGEATDVNVSQWAVEVSIPRPEIHPASWPPAEAVIDSETWPDAAETAIGVRYPWVIGRPGRYRDGASWAYARGSVAYLVDTTGAGAASCAALVAGHECWPGDVTIMDTTTGSTDQRTLATIDDGTGRRITVVYLDGTGSGGALDIGDGTHTYAVYWLDPGGNPGAGLLREDRSAPMEGAGDVVVYLAQQAGLHDPSLASAKPGLNQYRLQGVLPDSDPWATLRDAILPSLPVATLAGRAGLVAHPWAQPTVWAWTITRGQGAERLDSQRDDKVSFPLRLDYAYSTDPSRHVRSISSSVDAWPRAMQAQEWEGEASTLQVMTGDEPTVGAVMSWRLRAYGRPRTKVTYGVTWPGGVPELGTWGWLIDDELDYAGPAWCRVVRVASAPAVELLIYDR